MRNKTLGNPQTTTKPLRYFIYARKSTERDERQIQSIPDQLDVCIRQAGNLDINIVGEFTESMSARKPGRPVLAEMLDRIEAGEADSILSWHPDRLARNTVDGGRIVYLLDTGALKHLAFANFWFENTSQGKMNLGYAFVNSKYYTDNLSENVKRGMLSKAKRGIYPNGLKRGYYCEPRSKEMQPDPENFPLIKQMFKLYLTGDYSMEELRHLLHRQGLTTRDGKPLFKQSIANLLTDPFYYGAFVWSGELYEGIHKPIVSKKQWDKVQVIYTTRSRPQSRKTEKHPFCGLLRCAECGMSITAENHSKRQKNGNVHHYTYYRCTKKGSKACGQPYVREELLVGQLMDALEQVALPDDWVVPMLERLDEWSQDSQDHAAKQRAVLSSKLKKIAARLRKLTDLYLDGDLDREEYRSRKQEFVNEKIALQERRSLVARKGAFAWLEPLRELINSVRERSLPTEGGDLSELSNFVARVGSNWILDSRKVLWNWSKPYSLLAERNQSLKWSGW